MAIKDVVNKAKNEALKVNASFENEIDPYVNKWVGSKVTGWIAVGFGVALLVIGFVFGKLF